MPLPTDAIILAILASMLGNADEVHHALIIAQVLGHTLKVRVIGANHNCLCMTKNRIDILDHQFGNVWNMIEDEVPVGTDQAGPSWPHERFCHRSEGRSLSR